VSAAGLGVVPSRTFVGPHPYSTDNASIVINKARISMLYYILIIL